MIKFSDVTKELGYAPTDITRLAQKVQKNFGITPVKEKTKEHPTGAYFITEDEANQLKEKLVKPTRIVGVKTPKLPKGVDKDDPKFNEIINGMQAVLNKLQKQKAEITALEQKLVKKDEAYFRLSENHENLKTRFQEAQNEISMMKQEQNQFGNLMSAILREVE